jgi:hypothetical protein
MGQESSPARNNGVTGNPSTGGRHAAFKKFAGGPPAGAGGTMCASPSARLGRL